MASCMAADTGERGEYAGHDRKTQSSGGGLGAVAARRTAEEDAYVPISSELAADCAPDALEACASSSAKLNSMPR